MASLFIRFVDKDNRTLLATSVVGKKVTGDSQYDHYYVKKPNPYGIKWVLVGREGRENEVCIEGSHSTVKPLPLLSYSRILITK